MTRRASRNPLALGAALLAVLGAGWMGSPRGFCDSLTQHGGSQGFGMRFDFHCDSCNQTYPIPTRSRSEAERWAYQIHKPACLRRSGAAPSAPAEGSGNSLRDAGFEALSKGIAHKDQQMAGMGVAAIGMSFFLDGLFSSGSDSAEEELRAQRRRQRLEQERARQEASARESLELLRMSLQGTAAEMQEEMARRDAERAEQMGGVFDVVRPARSTAFFGIPGNPSEEEVAAALAEDARPQPVRPFAMSHFTTYSSDVVALTSDAMQVDPAFLEAGRIRAAATQAYWNDRAPAFTVRPPDTRAWPDAAGAVRERARKELIEELKKGTPYWERPTVNLVDRVFRDLGSLDLRRPDVEYWKYASERIGFQFYKDMQDALAGRMLPEAERLDKKLDELVETLQTMKARYEWATDLRRLDDLRRVEFALRGAKDLLCGLARDAGTAFGPPPAAPLLPAPAASPPAAPAPGPVAPRPPGIEPARAPVPAPTEPTAVQAAAAFPDGGGYNETWTGSGSPVEIRFKDQTILSRGQGGTYCSGYTFAVAMKTAEEVPAFQSKSVDQVRQFQREWYGATPESREKQCVTALVNLGVGKEVKSEEARAGDFLQLWRAKSGHSAVFLGWVKDGQGRPIGVTYRSSQGSTDGIGEHTEYFRGVTAIDANGQTKTGTVDPQRLYFGRLNP